MSETTRSMRKPPRAILLPAPLALLPCLAPLAQAAYDPLGGGTTKLVLDKRFVSFLKKDGVKLTASAPAKRKGKAISLPVSGGRIDPTNVKGEIEQEGTLVFQDERKRVPLCDLTVKTKSSPLVAKVGGSQLKVATSSKLSSKRSSGTNSGWTSEPRATAPKSTSSPPRPSPASWGGSGFSTSAPQRSPRIRRRGPSRSPEYRSPFRPRPPPR